MEDTDLALPECIEFSEMQYIAFSFQEGKHRNYDLYFFVNTSINEQPKVVLISPSRQRIELIFGPTSTIGIKGFKLCYNPTDLVKINLEVAPCKFSKDGKHLWQEKFSSKNMAVITCADCNHTRILATPELITQWKDSGFIS